MRHGSAGRFPTRVHVILNRFDLFDEDFLGAGSESRVYAMDDKHVLRIYHESISWDYVEERRQFYAELAHHDLPFAVPGIYAVGAWVGHVYTVERRMAGRDFSKVLPALTAADRTKALSSYLDAAAALSRVHFPEKPYGELLAAPLLQREHWADYLVARMEQTLASSRADLDVDVPNLDGVLASLYAQLPILGDDPVKSLVHGDYFPGNVFISDDLVISGVGDFSYATVVGDARMDLAGAVYLLGASADYCPEDSAFLREQVAERWGSEMVAVIDWYRLYYSVFFSGCKADDPATYGWCVENLRAATN
jgi:aminoglycoside phosphotransferase (APT) family kinase protein